MDIHLFLALFIGEREIFVVLNLKEGFLFSVYADNWTTIDWIPVCVDDYYFEWEIIGRERVSMNFCYMKFNWIVCLGRWIMVWYLLICGDWIVFSKIFFMAGWLCKWNHCWEFFFFRNFMILIEYMKAVKLFISLFLYYINIFIGIIEL